jgi:very-short-patch-repair endonuclease
VGELVTPRQAALPWDDLPELPAEDRPGESNRQKAANLFAMQCRAYSLPPVERELRFAKAAMGIGWRFDFAWREYMLAVEIDGVVVQRIGGKLVVGGRHATITGIREDNRKINAAILLGWHVLRFLQSDVKPKLAIDTTTRVLVARGWRAPT